MKKYAVTWVERHFAVINADDKEEAKEKCLDAHIDRAEVSAEVGLCHYDWDYHEDSCHNIKIVEK